MSIFLYTRVVRGIFRVARTSESRGYTFIYPYGRVCHSAVLHIILNKMRDSRCHSERSEESLGV